MISAVYIKTDTKAEFLEVFLPFREILWYRGVAVRFMLKLILLL